MAVGEIKTSAGTSVNVGGTQRGAIWRADKEPHFLQAVRDGLCFTGSNVMATPVTTQAGLSATTPALTIYNPIGSTVNLWLLAAQICCAAAPAAATYFALAWNLATAVAPATTTNGTITNNSIGSLATGQGK